MYVLVLITEGKPSRIFRHTTDGWKASVDGFEVRSWDHTEAVKSIRKQVYSRSEQMCEYCGEIITWSTMHMHEKIPKGKGGEVSLENCVALCAECHLNKEHGDRKWGGREKSL